MLFVSQAGALPETYLRYLTNSLREAFDLPGVPLACARAPARTVRVTRGARAALQAAR